MKNLPWNPITTPWKLLEFCAWKCVGAFPCCPPLPPAPPTPTPFQPIEILYPVLTIFAPWKSFSKVVPSYTNNETSPPIAPKPHCQHFMLLCILCFLAPTLLQWRGYCFRSRSPLPHQLPHPLPPQPFVFLIALACYVLSMSNLQLRMYGPGEFVLFGSCPVATLQLPNSWATYFCLAYFS